MSRRTRNTTTKFSLFSFQDIITCLMGIMLLVTLMICLQIKEPNVRAKSEVKSRAEELKQVSDSLKSDITELQTQIEKNIQLLESGALSSTQLLKDKHTESEAAKAAAERELAVLMEREREARSSAENVKSRAESRRERSEAEMTRLKQSKERQEQILKDIRDGKRVVYNQYIGSAASCWIVEATNDTTFAAAQIGKSDPPVTFNSITEVLKWIRKKHNEDAEFMILLKPDAQTAIDRLPGTLREEQIAHAYDLLGQDQTALDPVTGASTL
jgi:hypothetical protein